MRRGDDYISPNGEKETQWYCNCDCGAVDYLCRRSYLTKGRKKSCGCELRLRKHKDIKGMKFGHLTAIRVKPLEEYTNKKRACVQWYCDCDCGTKNHLVDVTTLRAGKIKSCGCAKNESIVFAQRNNMIGKRFSRLTVLKESPIKAGNYKGMYWLCKCDCGGEKIVSTAQLRSGHIKSCGCLISSGEDEIRKILNSLKVSYETQYKFKDCISQLTNRRLKYDFAIFKGDELSFLCEYDGNQHVYGTRFSSKEEENIAKFEKLKLYDSIKNNYCRLNNIDLLRISYKDYENIEPILKKKLIEKGVI